MYPNLLINFRAHQCHKIQSPFNDKKKNCENPNTDTQLCNCAMVLLGKSSLHRDAPPHAMGVTLEPRAVEGNHCVSETAPVSCSNSICNDRCHAGRNFQVCRRTWLGIIQPCQSRMSKVTAIKVTVIRLPKCENKTFDFQLVTCRILHFILPRAPWGPIF